MKITNNAIERKIEALEAVTGDLQHVEAVAEVEAIVAGYRERYMQPEAVAEREREYNELQRIGELRRQAFERGESMDKYPLPWEKEAKND